MKKQYMSSSRRMERFSLVVSLFLALGTCLLLAAMPAKAADVTFVEYGSNPVYDPPIPSDRAYYPCVLYDASQFSSHGASYYYKMWYADGQGQFEAVTYSDDGISWSAPVQTTGILASGYHAKIIYIPGGYSAAGGPYYYKIWYWDSAVHDVPYTIDGIRTADSIDGVTWANDTVITQDAGAQLVTGVWPGWNTGTYGPVSVHYNSAATNTGTNPFDYTFAMYYDATTGGLESIGLGYSADGNTNWRIYGSAPVLDHGTTGDWDSDYASYGTVIKGSDCVWRMWYSGSGPSGGGNQGIGYATSTDGISWTKDPDNPIFSIYQGVAWRNSRCYTPSVLYSSTGFDGHGATAAYKMWFTGEASATGNRTIGYANITVGAAAKLVVTLPGETFTSGSGNCGTVTAQTAGTAFNLTLTAVDASNNTDVSYSGTKTISYSGPGGSPTYTTSVTFTNGQATSVSTTLTKAETTTITATDGSLTGVASSSLTVNAGTATKLQVLMPGETAAPGTSSGKSGSPTTQTAGAAVTVTVNAVDDNWNLVNTVTHTVAITSSDANAALPSSAALASGTQTFSVTFKTASVSGWTVTATDQNGSPLTPNTGMVTPVNAGALDRFAISAISSPQTVGTAFAITTITAQDANNNTVTGFIGTVDLTETGGGAGGTVTPSQSIAFILGVLSGQSVTLSKSGSLVTITATDHGGTKTGVSGTFTVDPAAASKLAFTTSPSGATGGATFSTQPVVTVQDAGGNTVTTDNSTQVTVAIGTNPSSGTLSGTKTVTVSSGVATFSGLSIDKAGTGYTLTATSSPSYTSATSSAFNVTAGTATKLIVTLPGETFTSGVGNSGTVTAQTAGTAFTITLAAVDASNNTDVSYSGPKTISYSGPGGSPTYTTSVTFTNGQATSVSTTLTKAETTTITATDGSLTGVASSSLTVNAGALTNFLVEAAGGGGIAPQTADAAFNIKITARDANNNTVTGFSGTVQITSNGVLTGSPVTSGAFVAGVLASQSVTITSAQLGTTLSVTESVSGANGTSNSFTVNPAGLGNFLITNAAGGSIDPQTAGTGFGIKITARDPYNNVITDFSAAVALTTTAGSITPNSVTFTGSEGGFLTVDVSVTEAGTLQNITATSGGHFGASNDFTVNPAGLGNFLITNAAGGSIDPQTAGTGFGIKITARDQYNNTVTDFTGAVALTTNAGSITPSSVPFASGDNGVVTISVTLTQSGTDKTITATFGSDTGTSNTFTVNGGSLNHFKVEAAGGGDISPQTAWIPFAIRITAQDANNNTVSSFNGTVEISSTGNLSSGSGTTLAFTNGVLASHSVTISTGGSFTITATKTGSTEFGTSNTFTVNNPAPTTTSISPSSKTYGDAAFTMTINGTNFVSTSVVRFNGSNRPTTFVSSTQLTASIPASDMTVMGSFPITVFNPTPEGGTSNAQTFTVTVSKADQTITFGPLSNKTYGDLPFTVSATASSGLAVSFSIVSGPATISGNTVTIIGAGTVTVRASQGGNENYNPAPDVDQSFTVTAARENTTTVVTSSVNPSVFGQSVTFTATVSSGVGTPTGTVSFKDGATNLGSGTLNASGQATFTTSSLSVGSHSITAEYSGDANFNGSTSPVLTQVVHTPATVTIPSATGRGNIILMTNSPGCWFSNVQAFTEAQIGVDPDYDYPYGLVGFTVNCSAADVSITFTGATDLTGLPYQKYGPTTPGDLSTTKWYTFNNVTVTGNTYILHLQDGVLGDDTAGGDNMIVDEGGPGQPQQQGAVPIPTLTEWGMIIFMLLAALGSIRYLRRLKRV